MILPFEGQGEVAVKTAPKTTPQKQVTPNVSPNGAPRRQVSQPTGKLTTVNVGIKDTLNPKVKKGTGATQTSNSNLAEEFTFEQLERVWKEYSLGIKRERKDSLYTTLTKSKMTMSSDYQVLLEVHGVQATELEREKVELLAFLRSKLRNYSIGLKYTVIEQEKVQIVDSKGTFDKLAEENSSLNKFRKLFNLDIEF